MPEVERVSVILLNYHGYQDTAECLLSIKKAVKHGLAIQTIVVDVRDKEDLEGQDAQKLLKNFPEVTVLPSENKGYAGGNNVGIQHALEHTNPDYILLLNNDTRIHPNLFEELIKTAHTHKNQGFFVPKIYFENGREFHAGDYTQEERGKVLWYAGGFVDWKNMYAWHRGVDEVDHGQFDTEETTQFATGCCLLIPVQTLKSVGLFNKKYFLYLEDLELSQRLHKKGGKIWYVPTAVVWHKNAGSTGGSGSQMHTYYFTRNRLLFGMTYAPFRARIALLREVTKKLFHGKPEEKEAVRDYFIGKFGARRHTT